MGYNFNTGTYSWKITTTSKKAQTWFDRGLIWAYGFHWEESVVCFKKATEADPNCAMAWWGVAYSVGPEYNRMWKQLDSNELETALNVCFEASQKAINLSTNISEIERDVVYAILSLIHI